VTQEQWSAVDGYFTDLLVPNDPALEQALRNNAAWNLPAHDVSALQGKLLFLLARAIGARTVLELGALGGYSTIWLARAVPDDGRVVSLEANAQHAEVARANVAQAGLAGVVDVRVGPALETLPKLTSEGAGPFDLVFLDADKPNYVRYYEAVLPRLSERGLIVVDNTLWGGTVLDEADDGVATQAVRAFNDHVRADDRAVCTLLTVRDGVTLIRRR
jgi:predicted O-methyltransferase YrrM